jgi:hypothetical protein
VSSEAYKKLYELSMGISIDADWMFPFRESNRVAVYLSVIPGQREWMAVDSEWKFMRDRALKLLPGLTDSEWNGIQEGMMVCANRGHGSVKIRRTDWTRCLDTLREFERE